jgi:ankyrin repeat protein
MPTSAHTPRRTLIHFLLLCLAICWSAASPARAAEIAGSSNDQPIHDAARLASAAAVATLLKAQPGLREVRNAQGSTPLHLAATNPDTGALKVLLAAGADVNARDLDGLTPLHMAAYTQNAAHARLLLEAGADPYAKTHIGRDPTSMARKTMANEVAGVISLWILKACVAGKPC